MVGDDIKNRLNTYRRQKYREEMSESFKNVIQSVLPWSRNKSVDDSSMVTPLNDIKVRLCHA